MCEKLVLLVISAMTVLALAACGKPQPEPVIETAIEPVVEGPVDMPDPIAVYCTELGGTVQKMGKKEMLVLQNIGRRVYWLQLTSQEEEKNGPPDVKTTTEGSVSCGSE
jgi:putative hemolysin